MSGSRSSAQESPGTAPTRLDVSRLHRQPGSMLEISREIPAPADLAVAMARVPDGSPIDLDLTLESVVEGIWVSGTADVEITAECSRCLEATEWSETVTLEQLYRYPATDARGALLEGDEDSDDETPEVVDDVIDIEAALRDAVVLALPIAPLCSPECLGICATCGERLTAEQGPHDHPVTDPRWSALQELLAESPPQGDEDR